MLKSWKTRALATAGAVALAAPFAFMGGASAAAGTATITSVNSTTGNFEAGSNVTVNGAGCAQTGTNPTQTATIRLRDLNNAVVSSAQAAVLGSGTFQGTLNIPSNARVGDMFTVSAFCIENGVQGTESTGGNGFTVTQGSVLTGSSTLSGLAGTGSSTLSGLAGNTSLSGSQITSTSGQTSSGNFGTTGTTGTTGVATPITATPSFTG